MSIKHLIVITATLLLALAAIAPVQAAKPPTAQRLAAKKDFDKAVKNFKLTPVFLHKWEAYSEDAIKAPCKLSPMIALKNAGQKPKSLDQAAAIFDSQPGVHVALKRHGLTARETIVGMATLMSAAMQNLEQKHPEVGKSSGTDSMPKVSAANMAFYRKHKQQIRKHAKKIGREQLKRNGGKLPACLTKGQ